MCEAQNQEKVEGCAEWKASSIKAEEADERGELGAYLKGGNCAWLEDGNYSK